MRALGGKAAGDGGADAPRGAGDEGDPAGELLTPGSKGQAVSASSESWVETLPESWSTSGIG
jgi:hypothetical protein